MNERVADHIVCETHAIDAMANVLAEQMMFKYLDGATDYRVNISGPALTISTIYGGMYDDIFSDLQMKTHALFRFRRDNRE